MYDYYWLKSFIMVVVVQDQIFYIKIMHSVKSEKNFLVIIIASWGVLTLYTVSSYKYHQKYNFQSGLFVSNWEKNLSNI